MGLLTRVTDNNPFSKDIDELLEKRADVQEKDTEDGIKCNLRRASICGARFHTSELLTYIFIMVDNLKFIAYTSITKRERERSLYAGGIYKTDPFRRTGTDQNRRCIVFAGCRS